jgi:tetratricopeptide (TPR) repeat protein
MFDNLGDYQREVSTRSINAQPYFDQGLTLYFGFNHEEAIRSFEQVSLLDPECAMAPWGVALALGPNINNPAMDEATSLAAHEAVQRAIVADLGYVERVGRHGFYTLYRAHNYHFLAYAAMFEAQREVALRTAREMIDEVPLELVRELPEFLDGFLVAPIHVMVRFGMWHELLEEPAPPSDLPVSTATWHYGRSVALSSLGRVEESQQEFAALEKAISEVPESYYIGNSTARVVLEVARPMAEGELEYRRGNYERAFELLREAVRRDDGLRYDEPRGWMQPVRHSLGALLLEQGRVEEAEATDELVRTAWARSDINPRVSCFCRTEI